MKATSARRPCLPDAHSRIHVLLQTMRCIEQHEERLCSALEEMERTGAMSPEVREELLRVLEELPAAEFSADVDCLRSALVA